MIEKLKFNYLNQSLSLIEGLKQSGANWFEATAEVSNLNFDDQLPIAHLARALHTIKGGAAVLDFETIRMFAQQAEKFSKSAIDYSRAFLMIQHIEKLIHHEISKLQSFSSPDLVYSSKDLKLIFEDLAKRVGKNVLFEIEDKSEVLLSLNDDFVFQVIFPILLNAIDHGIETFQERLVAGKSFLAQVRLEIECRKKNVVLLFADDGRGQAGNQTQAYSGEGLGLDIARTIIENLNGTLRFEPTEKSGTFVFIEIPRDMVNSNLLNNAA